MKSDRSRGTRLGALTGVVTTAALLAACSQPATPPDAPAKVAWFTASPAAGEGSSYTGVVRARTESNLGFRVSGKILARLVDPGDHVVKGQALMRLDASDYQLAVNAAHAALAAAQARQVQAAADEARQRKLLAAGAASAQAYEAAKAGADSAKAQVEAEQARARQTEHQGQYAVLQADAAGVVMEVPAEPGQVVAAGQTVVKLARDGAREAAVQLPEQALGAARRSASAQLYGSGDAAVPVTLRELAAVADPVTRTYAARYTLAAGAAAAPLGATVTVRLDGAGGAQIGVPVSALVDRGQGTGVWVIDAKTSTVSLRPVKVSHLGQEQARLSQGLQPGERAVSFGGHLLKAGQKVQLMVQAKTGQGS